MRRVLIISDSTGVAGRNRLAGIFGYAAKRQDWSLMPIINPSDFESHALKTILNCEFDGTIICAGKLTPSLIELGKNKKPLAIVDGPPENPFAKRSRIVFVQSDNLKIGQIAAEYLFTKGRFASYAFIPTATRTSWSVYRERGFRSELGRHGIVATTWHANREPLASFLQNLPKPAAVLGATDGCAMNVITMCHKLRISIPSKIAVMGVDDDEILCESTKPSLTSVHTDDLSLGMTAASMLNRLMSSSIGYPPKTVFTPPGGITERNSTRTIPPAGRLIQNALGFIGQNANTGISAKDVAKYLHVSESLLRLRFREIYGKSVQDIILEKRFELAKKKLQETTLPMSQVASCCGFSSSCHFSHFFKARAGISPEKFRQQKGLPKH